MVKCKKMKSISKPVKKVLHFIYNTSTKQQKTACIQFRVVQLGHGFICKR